MLNLLIETKRIAKSSMRLMKHKNHWLRKFKMLKKQILLVRICKKMLLKVIKILLKIIKKLILMAKKNHLLSTINVKLEEQQYQACLLYTSDAADE